MAEMILKVPKLGPDFYFAKNLVSFQDDLYTVTWLSNSLGGGWFVVLCCMQGTEEWVERFRVDTENATLSDAILYVGQYEYMPNMYEARLILLTNRNPTVDINSEIIIVGMQLRVLGYGGIGEDLQVEIPVMFQQKCEIISIALDVYFVGTIVLTVGSDHFPQYGIFRISAVDSFASYEHILSLFPRTLDDQFSFPIGFHKIGDVWAVIANNDFHKSFLYNNSFEVWADWQGFSGSIPNEEIMSTTVFNGEVYCATHTNRIVKNPIIGTVDGQFVVVVDSDLVDVWEQPFLYVDTGELYLLNYDGDGERNNLYRVDIVAHSLVLECASLPDLLTWVGAQVFDGNMTILNEENVLVYIQRDDFYLWPYAIYGDVFPLRTSLLSTFGYNLFNEPDERETFDFSYVQNLLCAQDRKKATFRDLCKAFTDVYAESMPVITEIRNLRDINRSVGTTLEINGAIVNEKRNGRGDKEYRDYIFFKIFLLYSNGQPDAIIQFFKAIAYPETMKYTELYQAKILIEYVAFTPPPKYLYQMMKTLIAGGVGLRIVWNINDDPKFGCSESGNSGFNDPTTLGCGEVGKPAIGGRMVEFIT